MSGGAKDSAEVIQFMTLFARLKVWSDDSADDLSDMAEKDQGFSELCTELSFAAYVLKSNERRARLLFAAPVDSMFISAWRDYEERYEPMLSGVWLSDLSPETAAGEQPRMPKADLLWDNADDQASGQAAGIQGSIEFAQFNADQENRWIDQPEFIERVHDGIAAWEGLKEETGFDLRGVFRRRALIPFVLD